MKQSRGHSYVNIKFTPELKQFIKSLDTALKNAYSHCCSPTYLDDEPIDYDYDDE